MREFEQEIAAVLGPRMDKKTGPGTIIWGGDQSNAPTHPGDMGTVDPDKKPQPQQNG